MELSPVDLFVQSGNLVRGAVFPTEFGPEGPYSFREYGSPDQKLPELYTLRPCQGTIKEYYMLAR